MRVSSFRSGSLLMPRIVNGLPANVSIGTISLVAGAVQGGRVGHLVAGQGLFGGFQTIGNFLGAALIFDGDLVAGDLPHLILVLLPLQVNAVGRSHFYLPATLE